MVKQVVLEVINELPDDVSLEEIMYKLYILKNHSVALEQIKNGEIFTT